MAVIVWLIAWYALARRWHARPPVMTSALVATFVLIGVGVVGTFPLFFELFAAPLTNAAVAALARTSWVSSYGARRGVGDLAVHVVDEPPCTPPGAHLEEATHGSPAL